MERIIALTIAGIIITYCMYVLYEIFVTNPRERRSLNKTQTKQSKPASNILNKFIHKKPRCLENFDTDDTPTEIKNNWVQGPEFLSKLIKCKCGEEELYVYASSNKEMLLAPIYLECPKCLSKSLIFDPTIHGWDGENGDSTSLIGEIKPKKVYETPRRVIVNYSFQNPDNYAELMEDGIDKPEDYFDVIIINTINDGGKLEEVVSYECA